jgi:hypothetical protein
MPGVVSPCHPRDPRGVVYAIMNRKYVPTGSCALLLRIRIVATEGERVPGRGGGQATW